MDYWGAKRYVGPPISNYWGGGGGGGGGWPPPGPPLPTHMCNSYMTYFFSVQQYLEGRNLLIPV